MRRALPLAGCALRFASCLLLPSAALAANPMVRFDVPGFGGFDVELCQEVSANCLGAAPNTVAYFQSYVERGAYLNLGGNGPSSFIHRSISSFVIQGGGYVVRDFQDGHGPVVDCVEDPDPMFMCMFSDPPVKNEFNQSNRRGTVALARTAGQPDSGVSEWFINLGDNGGSPNNLDSTDGGYTVFGVVVGDGMMIVDEIAALSRLDLSGGNPSSPFTSVPVTDAYPCNAMNGVCTADYIPYLVYYSVPEPSAGVEAVAALAGLALLGARRPR